MGTDIELDGVTWIDRDDNKKITLFGVEMEVHCEMCWVTVDRCGYVSGWAVNPRFVRGEWIFNGPGDGYDSYLGRVQLSGQDAKALKFKI